jgi:hypothetical protein
MNRIGKVALSALMLTGATAFFAAPASAQDDLGFSFGIGPGFVPYSDPCDYYDYYDEPPPWGLPPDYCNYPVYFEPVYYDGYWYRGPIYSRWYGGERLFWLNGGWRHDEWRGGGRPDIRWQDRGGWGRGNGAYRGGYDRNRSYDNGGGHNNFYSGGGHTNWSGNGGNHTWSGGNSGGNNNVYSGGGHANWSGNGGNHTRSGGNNNVYSGGGHTNWSGNGGSHTWSGGSGGGHSWSGGGSGGHSWSGGSGGGYHGGGGSFRSGDHGGGHRH